MGLLWGFVTPTTAADISRNDVASRLWPGAAVMSKPRLKAVGRAVVRLQTPGHQAHLVVP